MPRPKNLVEPVAAETPAERLLEATLPVPAAHRQGDAGEPERLLSANPEAATDNVWVAAATGQADAVVDLLSADPELANQRGGTRSWEPLLYLAFSRLLRDSPERRADFHRAARALLGAGADPDAHWLDPAEGTGNRETALYGAAGIANDTELTRLLMDAGADPNDGETYYHMVEHPGVPCASIVWPRLCEEHRTIALLHQLDYEDLDGLRELVELGADPNGTNPFGKKALHQAVIRGRMRPWFDLLFEHGADPNLPDRDGRTPYQLAARTGRAEAAAWLEAAGADTTLDTHDAFLAACARGDTVAAQRLREGHPEVISGLTPADRGLFCEVAGNGVLDGVLTMLELGWDIDTPGLTWGERAIHRAAMNGHRNVVEHLYERGADLTLRDRVYDASPLGWADHGGHHDIVRLLATDLTRLDARDRGAIERLQGPA